ncbi:hypothetical protein C8A00DRAFT_31057 [Chaetomidium leptoderma]|uniref:Uncharacterized protein n=1 Tax=Chaetomidium leptoderma TaxID=669021 RepID=A0AAN7A0V5_9PEZI|nr:hypothetical protein C8A00DRAFT_31057 [Chaetomidium leptoderma]
MLLSSVTSDSLVGIALAECPSLCAITKAARTLREQSVAYLQLLTPESAPDTATPALPTTPFASPLTPGHPEHDGMSWACAAPSPYSDCNGFDGEHQTRVTPEQDPKPQNTAASLYTDSFLPFPSRSQPGLHTGTSWFVETCQRSARTTIDGVTILSARYAAIQGLQGMVARPDKIGDGVIEAVVKHAVSDLCYGEMQDLRVHVGGVRDITRLRGGLAALGINGGGGGGGGQLAKTVFIIDLVTSSALETAPSFSDQELSDYTESLLHDTLPTPSIPPTTAAVLKDMEFLFDAVLALPPEPSTWQLQKVQTMSGWVQSRLSGPGATTKASSSSSSSSSSTFSDSSSSSGNLDRAVRLSSLLYCRAIQTRQPFSQVVQPNEAVELVDAVRGVPVEVWEGGGLLKTLVSVLVVVLPAVRDHVPPPCDYYSTRVMMVAAAVQLAMTDWKAAVRVLGRVAKLQAWLRGPLQG